MNENDYCISKSKRKLNNLRKQQLQQKTWGISRIALQSVRERRMALYVKEKKICEVIDFLIGNLLLRRPSDPYEYLTHLLNRLILFHNGLVNSSFAFSSQSIIKWARQINLTTISNLMTEEEQKIEQEHFNQHNEITKENLYNSMN